MRGRSENVQTYGKVMNYQCIQNNRAGSFRRLSALRIDYRQNHQVIQGTPG